MYTIKFNSWSDSENESNKEVHMAIEFPESPTWYPVADAFLNFLRAQGFVFSPSARFEVTEGPDYAEDIVDKDSEGSYQYESIPEEPVKRKSKKKTAK